MSGSIRFLTSPPGVSPVEPVGCTPEQRRIIHMLAAKMLDYPEHDLSSTMAAYRGVRGTLPMSVQQYFDAFACWADEIPLRDAQEHYVQTFDQRRRTALYLSYYVAGDTRLRGSAILGFKEFAKALGYETVDSELDDYLPVLLELSAVSGDPSVGDLLAAHRDGIEVMRSALHSLGDPYAALLDAVASTLPAVANDVRERFQRLVSQGPPSEMVGTGQTISWSRS